MVRLVIKYLFAIGVVFFGFQLNAFADEEKEKKEEKSTSTTAKRDTIVIKTIGDITVGDTLVFDDFDEDEDDDGENGSIAMIVPQTQNPKVIQQSNSTLYQTGRCSVVIQTIQVDQTQIPQQNNSVLEETELLEINVYPNPTAQALHPIHITHNLNSEVQISIFSINGQLAKTISTTDKMTTVSDLNTGIYVVTIIGENQMESRKLIVH